MTDRTAQLKKYILDKRHHQWRRTPEELGLDKLSAKFQSEDMEPAQRSVEMLAAMLEMEQPVILPAETIVFTRTITYVPDYFTDAEWKQIKKSHFLHERGTVSNLSPNYITTIEAGFDERRAEIEARLAENKLSADSRHYLGLLIRSIDLAQGFITKYEEYALTWKKRLN